ncbi:MAG: hypothetical protein ACLSUW_09045 [Akkermansia sp.]
MRFLEFGSGDEGRSFVVQFELEVVIPLYGQGHHAAVKAMFKMS